MSLFGGLFEKTTTQNTTNLAQTTNTSISDSYNATLNQSFSKNVSNLRADSYVSNYALDARRSYNLADVGNIAVPGMDLRGLDLSKFFDVGASDSPAISSMDFGGAVTGIGDKLRALTGLQSATLGGLADQTYANKSDSPTAPTSTGSSLWLYVLAFAAIVALVFIARKK